jgi:hypothetical protein
MSRSRDIANLGEDKATLAAYVDTGVTSTDLERIDVATEGTTAASKVVTADASGHVTYAGEIRGPATFVVDPATVGDATGLLHVKGGLQVDGTTTTLNSTTLQVDDKLIELAHSPSGSEGDDTAIDGGGIILKSSDSDKSITWTNSTDSWDFNQGISVTGGATISADLTVDTNTLKVDSTNNRVGIGITGPPALLSVNGAATAAMTSTWHYGQIEIKDTSAYDSGYSAGISFKRYRDGANAIQVAGIGAYGYSHTNCGLAFYTNNGTNNDLTLERIRIDSSGNVGIGVSDPSSKLTVNGDIETSTTGKIKQKGAFMQSSTHQALVLGY